MNDTNPAGTLDAPLIVEPSADATAAVIWLHGLGADGNDFAPIPAELGDAIGASVRFIFPHAPRRPVTINQGNVMRAWYDIAGADLRDRADADGVRASAALLDRWMAEQIAAGIAASRIVLAGFSQGGVIALHSGLRARESLAGILALSTYLALGDSLRAEASAANAAVPIFLAHGSQDQVIALGMCEQTRTTLREHGYRPELHTYPMPHSVCAEQVHDVRDWLERVLEL